MESRNTFPLRVKSESILSDLNLKAVQKRVLVVEDDDHWRDDLCHLLSGSGHIVDAFDGIARLEPLPVVATLRGITHEIALETYEVAFLDYFFLGGIANGGDMATRLSAVGKARIMGMSSDSGANSRMLAQGAHYAMRKSVLRAILLGLR